MDDALERERDEHRVLTSEVIGHPSEERAADAVEHAVHRQRERKREQRDAEQSEPAPRRPPKSFAIGVSCAVAISPPVAVNTNIT